MGRSTRKRKEAQHQNILNRMKYFCLLLIFWVAVWTGFKVPCPWGWRIAIVCWAIWLQDRILRDGKN